MIDEPPAAVWTQAEVAVKDVVLQAMPFNSWHRADARLAEISELEDGWDGINAVAPKPEVLDSVAALLQRMHQLGGVAPIRIVPTEDGAIIIEWSSPGELTTLEVERPYEGGLWHRRSGSPSHYSTHRWHRWLRGVVQTEVERALAY